MTQFINSATAYSLDELARCHDHPVIVSNLSQILALQPLLVDFCARCGQENGWDDLKYYFALPFARNKRPLLLLFTGRPSGSVETLAASDLIGVVLIQEYVVYGWRTRVFWTDDYSARRTVIAPAGLRAEVVRAASQVLMERGAAISVMSYQEAAPAAGEREMVWPAPTGNDLLCSLRRREIPSYLPLLPSYEATLGILGKKTRSHMRYYRRRAERDLGCSFVAEVEIDREAFREFNQESSFSTTENLADVRFRSLTESSHAFLSGIRDKDGRWLSLVGGTRVHGSVEIYWQMNLASLPDYSLSTVMRAFLIEAEIARGTQKLFIEGGTPHPMRSYFLRQGVCDFIVKNKSLYTRLIEAVAKTAMSKGNYLATLLSDKEEAWHVF